MKALLLALLLTSCSTAAWKVDCDHADRAELDARYRLEVLQLKVTCEAYDNYTDCPEYHEVWRRYWSAVRELQACQR